MLQFINSKLEFPTNSFEQKRLKKSAAKLYQIVSPICYAVRDRKLNC